MEIVVIDISGAAFKKVAKPGVGVLADRDKEIGWQIRPVEATAEFIREALGLSLVDAIEEVVFELVKYDEEASVYCLDCRLDRRVEPVRWQLGITICEGLDRGLYRCYQFR